MVSLSPEESKHAVRVLRLTRGAPVELLDGLGNVYKGEIVDTAKVVQVRLLEKVTSAVQSIKHLSVYQAILRGEKMDVVVQKCTELGVGALHPFHSLRCQGKLGAKVSDKKYSRWQRIGLAACKQCYRPVPMQIAEPELLGALLEPETGVGEEAGLKLLFWEEEKETRLSDLKAIEDAASIQLMLGPEGGFAEEEVQQARLRGWQTVGLGERILRAETATLAAVSIVQHLRGGL